MTTVMRNATAKKGFCGKKTKYYNILTIIASSLLHPRELFRNLRPLISSFLTFFPHVLSMMQIFFGNETNE